ncbi:N-acyl-D-amino-acid deacylase family protein [Allopusillimonas ginsengisoli]|uniref:N-acyl-D-amino-acid deacylase family protein n=1 Tax=Allopusillimonas ginsengisoli TaxID=453575 RepID=UPI0010C1BE3C|nr:D-aminoacylase [Allopusillimonas ginsengisoli]
MEHLSYDVIIHGGWIVDGTGEPRYRADIGIIDQKIFAIGDLNVHYAAAAHLIDAHQRVVAPGFIDVHGHDDLMFVARPGLEWKTSQGVTTVIVGNCGVSAAPRPIAGNVAAALALLGDTPLFGSFSAYFAQLEAIRPMINVAALVGHANLRLSAMSDPVADPNPQEQQTMETLLDQALRAGAIGLSTGLAYAPGGNAKTAELLGLVRVAAKHGAIHTSHIRNEADDVEAAVDEVLSLGHEAGCATVISHHKCMMPANWGRTVRTLANFDGFRNQGIKAAMDVYPYNASSTILIPERSDLIEDIKITWSEPHPECAGAYLSDLAARWQCSRREAAERLTPAGAIYFAMEEADVQRVLSHPCCMVGSDGLPDDENPHPRLWGTFPRVLRKYVRQTQLLTLEHAVAKMTSLPASVFGLSGRGKVKVGMHADIVVFDPDTVQDRATWESPTLRSAGIDHVLVNGVEVHASTPPIRPGHVLKRSTSLR